jgi:hypothetical protein
MMVTILDAASVCGGNVPPVAIDVNSNHVLLISPMGCCCRANHEVTDW